MVARYNHVVFRGNSTTVIPEDSFRYGVCREQADVAAKPNEEQVRGLFATQNYKEGDVVLHIPFKLAVHLGEAERGPAVSPRNILPILADE
jgi:hypothetical protein